MSGPTVILFKNEPKKSEASDLYVNALRYHNFKAIVVPPTEFVYKNIEVLRSKLLTPHIYGGLILTSHRCVEAVARALNYTPLPNDWRQFYNYALGPSAYQSAQDLLFNLSPIGKQARNANNLCDIILKTYSSETTQLPLLLPSGNLVNSNLRVRLVAHGIRVDNCEIFESQCHSNFVNSMNEALQSKNIEFLVFFSSAAVNSVATYAHNKDISLKKFKLIAVGQNTRKACEDIGWKIHNKLDQPSVERLISILLK